jgi:hypothetical protein
MFVIISGAEILNSITREPVFSCYFCRNVDNCSLFVLAVRKNGETGSSVSIVSAYGLDDWPIEVRFPASVSRRALGPTQPVQWVPGVISPG